jgi:hypothetical protein
MENKIVNNETETPFSDNKKMKWEIPVISEINILKTNYGTTSPNDDGFGGTRSAS